MRHWRTVTANALSYVLKRRSTDLTFAAASHGTDADPEVQLYVRRAVAFRRAHYTIDSNAKLIKDILEAYEEKGEPGLVGDIKKNCESIRDKEIAEEPGSSERTRIRKQCDPLTGSRDGEGH